VRTLAPLFAVLLVASPAALAGPDDDSTIAFVAFDAAAASAPADTTLVDRGGSVGIRHRYIDAQLGLLGTSAQLAGGERSAYTLVPSLGGHIGWMQGVTITQAFAALRAPMQRRSGAGLSPTYGYSLGAEAGVRLIACGEDDLADVCAGISVALRYDLNRRGMQMGSAVLPEGSSVGSIPVSLFVGRNLNVGE
jgi:hypothetical protein